jgi:DNA-binding response OmpR family regulator
VALRVLCIDDDLRLYELLAAYFEPNGVTLVHAADGAKGLTALAADVFDAVLLDVMMPGMDGLEVCRRLRQTSQVPVIMLTARGDEADRVVGLELGADDYVPKPFSPRELLARLRAVLRRAQPASGGNEIVIGRVAIDVAARRVRAGAEEADLTGLEFDILLALARRPGRVVPRETLLVEAGRQDVTVSDRTVDVHVSHLRRKLGDDPRTPRLIKTVRGVGYVMAPEAAAAAPTTTLAPAAAVKASPGGRP